MQDAVLTPPSFLTLSGISKRYGGVRALEGVDFACERGKIHAVLGENGAGKSTLIKIIAGVVQPDAGGMRLAGSDVSFATPSAANAAGIVCIFQELSLMPDLSVADNISITTPPRRLRMIDPAAQPPPPAATPGRGGGHPHQPPDGGKNPAAVAPPEVRDRHGARPRPETAHPRRGDIGAD